MTKDQRPQPRQRQRPRQQTAAAASLERSVEALKDLQHHEGWWKGELETNVTMDAEDLLLRQFLGIRTERQTAGAAKWIRSRQRDDGTWATYYGGPPDLSTTIEAYVALRLAGDAVDDPHMRRASTYIREAGGIGASRVFTRIWLALFGQWPWERLPVMPPELMLLPPSIPLNIYDFACWARQTVVALTVISAHRPVRDLSVDIAELDVGPAPDQRRSLTSWAGRFDLLDRFLHVYERRPLAALRRFSLGRAERWIITRQEADGSWGGIQPPWVYSLMALHLQGYALDHPVMQAGLDGLEGFTIEDDAGRRIEACQSPVWDTALAVVALADAGVAPDDPHLRAAGRWLVGEEITVPGDWTVRRPDLAPGGWAFEFANDNYPDIDDTAEVVLALRRTDEPDHGAVGRAVDWTVGMQCRDGGWGAFDVDNTRALCRELPFCDFGELIDPPSADVTAHVVEMLSILGRGGDAADEADAAADAAAPRGGMAPGGAGARWVLVRPVGRQPSLRNGCRGARPDRRRDVPPTPRGAPRRGLGRIASERRRRVGRGPPLLWRSQLPGSRHVQCQPDRLGSPGPPGRGRTRSGGGTGCGLSGREPAGRRDLGRDVVHRHWVPGGLHHQLPPLPPGLPCDGARSLRAGVGSWLTSPC